MNGIQDCQKLESVQSVSPPIGIEKRCSRCGENKSSQDFYVHPRTRDGLYPYCKLCAIKHASVWSKKNIEKMIESRKRWVKNNPEKSREINRRWKRTEKFGQWAKNYSAKKCELAKLWRMSNPEKVKENRKRAQIKMRSTPQGKLANRISARMQYSLKCNKKGRHWETLVGYTVEDLKKHLENKFEGGMNWENMGLWHIDHVVPVAVFNFEKTEDEDFQRCWALSNLQPLWAVDNFRKSNKLTKQFQPRLVFG